MGPRELFLRLGTAAVLGSLIGLERQRLDKAAGLRTHMLVSVGAALVMIVSAYGFEEVLRPARVVLDPSRVAAQVVSGIGFLGAGLILRRNQTVHGLTTAASVWAVSGIGLAAGGGLYLAATTATVLMLIILALIKPLEDRYFGRLGRHTLRLVVSETRSLTQWGALLRSHGLDPVGLHVRTGDRPSERQLEVTCRGATDEKFLALIDVLKGMEGVREVGYGEWGDSSGTNEGGAG